VDDLTSMLDVSRRMLKDQGKLLDPLAILGRGSLVYISRLVKHIMYKQCVCILRMMSEIYEDRSESHICRWS
jgi:hypothetical protein